MSSEFSETMLGRCMKRQAWAYHNIPIDQQAFIFTDDTPTRSRELDLIWWVPGGYYLISVKTDVWR